MNWRNLDSLKVLFNHRFSRCTNVISASKEWPQWRGQGRASWNQSKHLVTRVVDLAGWRATWWCSGNATDLFEIVWADVWLQATTWFFFFSYIIIFWIDFCVLINYVGLISHHLVSNILFHVYRLDQTVSILSNNERWYNGTPFFSISQYLQAQLASVFHRARRP